ncbi:MAG: tetratricopeptide repeat protein [Gemmatimonadetes bacterium]|nr:tetratricopeptide repeat protein [Gemmatimonadota bacterium]
MLGDHWDLVSETLESALSLPAEARGAFLRDRLDDRDLLTEIESLLEAHDSDASWLETPFFGPAGTDEALEGKTVGPYRIRGVVGEGGMGVVYRAERSDGSFDRTVALKVVKPGMDTRSVLRRFEAERRILGRLEHPAIARLYDAGATELGRPWLAMEFVNGVALTDYTRERRLSVRERLVLFHAVCQAVEHAHRNLIVHRDLKPYNILVRADQGGVALLDFGVAKLLEDEDGSLTRTGEKFMTRPYAAPEQILEEPITTATDVYALGVVLYELLADARPFVADGAAALERAILETDPRLPAGVDTELGAICLKALRKAPHERYGSAADIGADVQRWLSGLPVEARAPSALYHIRKFVARHRAGVTASAAAIVALAAIGLTYTRQITAERNTAQLEAEKARQVAEFMGGLFRDADPAETGGTRVTARAVLDRAAQRLQTEVTARPEIRAQLYRSLGEVYTSLALFPQADSILTRAAQIRSAALGDDHPDAADDLVARSSLALAQGRYAEADSLARLALALRQEHYGDTDPRSAAAMLAVASTAYGLGEYARAEEHQRAALRSVEAVRAPDHPETAAVKASLARTIQALDRFDEAEALFREALESRRRSFGDPHRDVATSLADLGNLHAAAAQFDRATPLLEQALEMERQLYGEEHPAVADGIRRLANVRMLRGDYGEAEALFLQATELMRTAFATPNVRLAAHLGALAANGLYQERWEESKVILDEALSIAETAVGETHPVTAQLLADRALAVGYLGDLDGSEADYRRVLDIERSLYGERHTAYVTTLASLGSLLGDMPGREAEGIDLSRDVLALRREILPADHPSLANTLYTLGTQLMYADQFTEAGTHIAESARIRRSVYGALDWRTIQADGRAAHLALLVGDLAAEKDLMDALDRSERELGGDFQWVTDQIIGYAVAHFERTGQPQKAAALQGADG